MAQAHLSLPITSSTPTHEYDIILSVFVRHQCLEPTWGRWCVEGDLWAVGAVEGVAAAADSERVEAVGLQITHHCARAVHPVCEAPAAVAVLLRAQPPVLQNLVVCGQGILSQLPAQQALVVDVTTGQINDGRLGD